MLPDGKIRSHFMGLWLKYPFWAGKKIHEFLHKWEFFTSPDPFGNTAESHFGPDRVFC